MDICRLLHVYMRFMVSNVVSISLCHFQTSLTEAGCDFLTAELNLHCWEETISAQLMNMPLPNSDDFRINITLYFEDTSICVRVDNALWSDVLIISHTSLFPPLPPFADPKPATPHLLSSLIHSALVPFFSPTPSSLLDWGTGEIIIMFWHMALAPRALGF